MYVKEKANIIISYDIDGITISFSLNKTSVTCLREFRQEKMTQFCLILLIKPSRNEEKIDWSTFFKQLTKKYHQILCRCCYVFGWNTREEKQQQQHIWLNTFHYLTFFDETKLLFAPASSSCIVSLFFVFNKRFYYIFSSSLKSIVERSWKKQGEMSNNNKENNRFSSF